MQKSRMEQNVVKNQLDLKAVMEQEIEFLMSSMFFNCKFYHDISNWNISNVVNTSKMFLNSFFYGDISKWNVEKHT